MGSEDLQKKANYRSLLASSAALLGKTKKLGSMADNSNDFDVILASADAVMDSRNDLISLIQRTICGS